MRCPLCNGIAGCTAYPRAPICGWCSAPLALCWCFIEWRARCEHRSSTRWPELRCYWAQRSLPKQRLCNKCVTYAGEGHMTVDVTASRGDMSGTCDPRPTAALNGITHIILIIGVVG